MIFRVRYADKLMRFAMTEKIYFSNSINDTEEIASGLCPILLERRFLCFYGGLGAGKTAFTRGIVKELAPECLGLVHSPTFAIVNEYLGKNNSIFHFDLYRIKDADDLYSTGFYDYADQNGIIITEWSENFESELPADAIRVQIEVTGENSRKITVRY